MELPIPNVGRRIRELRDERGLSLRVLAEECNLSVNAISMIERGESSPRVSSLHLIAKALQVRVTDFFESGDEKSVVFVKSGSGVLTQGDGVTIESLGTGLRHQQLEPFALTLEAGDGSIGDPVVHPGQEFVHCVEGQVAYTVGEESFLLEAGDSLLFDASRPHGFHNPGAGRARILLLLQAPEGIDLARERHSLSGP